MRVQFHKESAHRSSRRRHMQKWSPSARKQRVLEAAAYIFWQKHVIQRRRSRMRNKLFHV
jgi:hypothetical protein